MACNSKTEGEEGGEALFVGWRSETGASTVVVAD